jgi:hydrogenase expression/formation protein HypE
MNESSDYISLAHGNGGRLMRELIEELIGRELSEVLMDIENDAASLTPDMGNGELMMSTDGFTVKPLEFPGGDIGSLAIHGTVNDLAVSGATPLYLSLNLFIEEGLEMDLLRRVLQSLQTAAREADIQIACGDTKVLPRGEGSGLYLATTGIGIRPQHCQMGFSRIQTGDVILLSGPAGDHGIAVMLAREQFGLRGDIRSDAASVLPLTTAIRDIPGLRFMRDPTRGGVATVMNEIRRGTGLGILLEETRIPIRDAVRSVCEMLGYDPLYLACEGRVVAVVSPEDAEDCLQAWRQLPGGRESCRIGVIGDKSHQVILQTELGGSRVLEELEDDPLPRIC